jgi:hypothetical protein
MRNLKYSIEFFKNLAIERGGECLSNEFIGVNKKIKIKCEKGHIWDVVPYSLLKNSWCPHCLNRDLNGHFKKLTITEMQEIAKERGGKCLSEKYFDKETKLLWECRYGHQWMATPGNIKNSKNWCPHCVETTGERIINEYLSKNNILFEKGKRFNNCRSKYPLSFDFYLPEHKILIEYDGIQHFKPIRFNDCSIEYANEQYCELIKRDAIKNKYCDDNKIQLIRIPYTIKNIEEYLNNKLQSIIVFI